MNSKSVGDLCSVAVCDSQPILIEGVQSLLDKTPGFRVTIKAHSLSELKKKSCAEPSHIALIDHTLCNETLLAWLSETSALTQTVIWSPVIHEPETLRLIQSGVKGVLQKSVSPEALVSCISAVAQSQIWIDDQISHRKTGDRKSTRSQLTQREQQVFTLVEKGWKNRDIATELGIQAGTVKIHLRHILEKTGSRDRYHLALSGLLTNS